MVSQPARNRVWAMPRPMEPRPMTATFFATLFLSAAWARVNGQIEDIPFAHSRFTSCEAPRAIPLRRYPAATGNSKPLQGIP